MNNKKIQIKIIKKETNFHFNINSRISFIIIYLSFL